jgi:dienelactone hydrolase
LRKILRLIKECYMLTTNLIDYHDGDTVLEGYCAYTNNDATKKPVVIVVHDWSGKNQLACHKADELAKLGYIGFALDMYGKGKTGKTNDEKSALMSPLLDDRNKLLKRILAAYETAKKLEFANPNMIGVIGFCFGGLCALDLARSGADIKGAVSFHGLLNAPAEQTKAAIKAKVLALHGYADPMVTPDDVYRFAEEMTTANVDWQIMMYGHTMHAFTNPQANDPAFGTLYNKTADTRSWLAMQDFFAEVFTGTA